MMKRTNSKMPMAYKATRALPRALGASGWRGRGHDEHARQAMQADVLDERADVGLRALQEQLPAGLAQAPREHREIEHERGVREGQTGQVDDDIRRRADGL